jgi:putative transcriptional regulator
VDSLRGKLLLASPKILEPTFNRTVVLMTEHTDEGAMGLILNRPSETSVADAVPDLLALAEDEDLVYVGGPVAATAVVVLAEFEDPRKAALVVEGDLGFVPADAGDPERLAGELRRTRVFAGHSGWGPGQLEDELDDDAWIVVDCAREDVFTDDPEALWPAILRRMGGEHALLATMPADPSLN